jgi:protein involved in polysaccharide export with SLBB domain
MGICRGEVKCFSWGRCAGRAVLPVLLLSVAACSSYQATGPSEFQTVAESPAALPSTSPGTGAQRGARLIQPLDTLDIKVFNEPDLSVKVAISQEGSITYPLLGTVDLTGLTALQAERKLTELLGRDYLVSPSVTVVVERGAGRRVYLLGQVKEPGSVEIPVDESLTVVQAISRVGGFTDYAARDRVTVIRTRQGRKQTLVVNVAAMINAGDLGQDIVLQPEDVVSVPASRF